MDCSPFSPKSKTHITQRFIPNNPTQLATYADAVFCGMFSHDGSLYMTACKDENIRIYDTQTWKKVKTVRARNVGWSIISTDYSPDQKWLIYSSWSNYVHLANTSGTHEVHEALDFKPSAHRFCLFSIQFSSDSREILGGSSDRNIYIYDLERRDRVAKIRAHEDDINAVAFSDKSSQILISGSDDSLIKIWDRRTLSKGLPVGILPGHAHGITFIDPKGDSTYIISNSKDQTIKLWDLRTMKGTDFAEPKQNTFQYNSYGPMFMRRPQRRHDPQDQSLMTYEGHQVLQTLIRCRFSPKETTGQRYIYSGSYDGTVYVFDVISGELIRKLSGVRNTMRDVHWHPSLPIIVSCNWNGNVTRWDTDSSLPTHHEANIPPTSSASIRREGIVTQYDEIGDSD